MTGINIYAEETTIDAGIASLDVTIAITTDAVNNEITITAEQDNENTDYDSVRGVFRIEFFHADPAIPDNDHGLGVWDY